MHKCICECWCSPPCFLFSLIARQNGTRCRSSHPFHKFCQEFLEKKAHRVNPIGSSDVWEGYVPCSVDELSHAELVFTDAAECRS